MNITKDTIKNSFMLVVNIKKLQIELMLHAFQK